MMPQTTRLGPISWERMIGAVEDVRNRLDRATAALTEARIEYAVGGGNAVAAWVLSPRIRVRQCTRPEDA